MKVVAFLPAKGSSERIESKNLKLLDGKPLFLHTRENLVTCRSIDEVYLDSESEEILGLAPYLSYIPMKRDPRLADNRTDGHQMFYNEVCQVDADIYVQILGTSPFVKKETIEKGIDILIRDQRYDSVVLVRKEKQYTWDDSRPGYDIDHIPNSKDLPDTVIETMGLYMVRSDAAHRLKKRIGDKPYLLEASAIEAVDVNYPDDFYLAEMVARGLHLDEVKAFSVLANHLSSCVLSDTMWDLGLRDAVIKGLQLNLPDRKIMGRANTLWIRPLDEGEDFRGIYRGLDTYSRMRSGDIIIVQNDCPEHAYFGDLNCNLAIRAGAIGTIINGVTRDINKVTGLGYPVFATGYCCSDVRGIATVGAYGQKVCIKGIGVCPGDLIFADIQGVVVIPKRYEKKVLDKAIKAIHVEGAVVDRIMEGQDASAIYEKEGAF